MKEIKQGSKYRYLELALLATDLENANKAASICAGKLIRACQCVIDDPDIEASSKEYCQAIERFASKGITNREMKRMPPFSKHPGDHADIIKSLIETGKIEYIIIPKKTQGRQRKAYVIAGSQYKSEQTGSEFKSVYWNNNLIKWVTQAKMRRNGKVILLGYYDTEDEAIKKYNEFTAKHPGKFPKYSK